MEKRVIGGPGGLEVSLVGLGCNAFGRRVDEVGTHAVLDASIDADAKDHGHELLTLAISWLAFQQVTASVVVGGSKPEQMAANAAAAQWKMTKTQLSEIDQIVSKE